MRIKKKKKKIGAISTFIGRDAVIEGIIRFQGVLHLEGTVAGDIISEKGTLILGESAVVEAKILVDSAIIKGGVTGIVEAGTSIDVTGSARIAGEMYAPIISIDPGAVFNGNCGMKKAATSGLKIPDSPEIQNPEKIKG
jgi:cytoskeletal protein CcmA (bactofilin family)